ncbi:MAG: amidohydrolase family protein, partial [SAR324 cluster bacterium]|nr:amidohydrolase family protein [SAR324 cluster bacterium]
LKLDQEVGSIETGKKADLIMLDIRQPHLVPCHDPLALLVYSAQASDVITVMVDGKILVEERQLQALEMGTILEQADQQSIDLIERSQS